MNPNPEDTSEAYDIAIRAARALAMDSAHIPEIAAIVLKEIDPAITELEKLRDAINKHHAQKADDRCVFDDDLLYAAAGLPPVDRRVGDKDAMLANCRRFIERRCEAGGWPSYAELEAKIEELERRLKVEQNPWHALRDGSPMPQCGCRKCNPEATWFIACEKCGNKRCPHATDHELACTNSNEPGQKGSAYE